MTTNTRDQVRQFVCYFVSAVSSAGLYSSGHKHVLYQSQKAYASLEDAFEGRDEIVLMIVEEELVFDKIPYDRSMYINKFIQTLLAKRIEYLKISRAVELSELHQLVESLAVQGERVASFRKGAICLKKLDRRENARDDEKEGVVGLPLAAISDHEKMVFREIRECIGKNEKFSMKGVDQIVHSCVVAFQKRPVPFAYLSPLLALDEYTFTHCTNVCALNLSQAMALGIHGRLLHDIGIAGFLHDIGKLFIPKEILAKPGCLSDAERKIINQHPVKGAHYLMDNSGVPKLAVVSSYEHHMKFDGTGYPVPSVSWRQSICSQITAISDFFDALRTRRVYREPVPHEKVAAMVADGAGTSFNPELVRSFLGIIRKYRQCAASGSVLEFAAESAPFPGGPEGMVEVGQ